MALKKTNCPITRGHFSIGNHSLLNHNLCVNVRKSLHEPRIICQAEYGIRHAFFWGSTLRHNHANSTNPEALIGDVVIVE